MEYTITGISPDKLEEKLALFNKLVAKKEKLEKRLKKVEGARESVNKTIYAKVKAEYSGKLEYVREELNPVESELDEFKGECERELADLDEHIRLLEDELAEAEFRHRVGEFDVEKLTDIQSRLNPDLTDKSDRLAELSDRLKTFETNGWKVTEEKPKKSKKNETKDEKPDTSRTTVSPEIESPQPETAAEPAPSTDDQLETPGASESPQAPAEESPSFENPQDWIDEFGEEKKDKASSTDVKTATATEEKPADEADEDPLSALADPSDEQRDEVEAKPAKAANKRDEEVCTGFPNLVFVTGANSGRKVPLLPMTMSIGREHDNNIELKDPEVARYHARILFERGRFVLEDLESSNGTWLNGEQIKQEMLKNGDRVKIGDIEMAIDFD